MALRDGGFRRREGLSQMTAEKRSVTAEPFSSAHPGSQCL